MEENPTFLLLRSKIWNQNMQNIKKDNDVLLNKINSESQLKSESIFYSQRKSLKP